MAKKTKEKTIDIYNLKLEEKNQKKQKKKKPDTSDKIKKKKKEKDDKFDFDNEIVIGITQVKNTKQKNKKKNKKVNKKQNIKKDKPQTSKKKKTNQKKQNNKLTSNLIKWTILIICLIGSIIFFMLSPLFNIVEIKVEGNNLISKDQIISLSGIQTGQNMWKIVKRNVKENVKQNAYIQSVETKRNLPNTITIKVQERIPTFMLEFSSAYVYINNQGYILEINKEKISTPIITGYKTSTEEMIVGNRLCIEDLEKLETVLKIVESANSIEILNLITKIDIQDKQEYKLILEEEKKQVYLGDASKISTKLLYVKQILEREKENAGEIFANGDMSKGKVYFREEE